MRRLGALLMLPVVLVLWPWLAAEERDEWD
jgi:hypothetical protein